MATNSSFSAGMTFGIELEFIVVCPKDFFGKEDAVAGISRALVARGVNATGHECYDGDDDIFENKPAYSQWVVQPEGGLFLSEEENSAFHNAEVEHKSWDVEISSRKLNFSDDWQTEIATVLSVFDDFRARGVSFITNSTTGFHIHVGFGSQRTTLRTAKSVLQLCTAFEDRLDALYSIDRIDETCAPLHKDGEHFNAGLAWHFQNNKATDFGPNIFHWLVSIEEASSFKKLGDFFRNTLMSCDPDSAALNFRTNAHYATLNVDNLYEEGQEGQEPTGTIEFRQHAATLDYKEIVAHIELTRTLVTWCHLASDLEFLQLCSQVSNSSFRLGDVLVAIGSSDELLAYHEALRSDAREVALKISLRATLEKLEADELTDTEGLEAVSFAEKYRRSNWSAVSNKIHSKQLKGAYADLTTAPFDVAREYFAFYHGNIAFQSHQETSNMARTMVLQQLNGSDSS